MRAADWIGRQFERPLTLGERRVAFTAIAIVLIAAALLLAITSVGVPSGDTTRAARVPVVRVRHSKAPEQRQALAVARRFLVGYLAFVYGQQPARAIADATSGFRVALARRSRPAPPALRRLHPRIVSLKVEGSSSSGATVETMVKDSEVVAYPITLILTTVRAGRLRVSRVGES